MRRCMLLALAAIVSAATALAGAPKAKHVVLIGLDGWGAYSVRKADPATIPNIRKVMARGAWTLRDRAVLPSSSAINWATMFMGVPTEIHGYTAWNSRKPEIKPNVTNERGIQPTIFSELRRQRPEARIEAFVEWDVYASLMDKEILDVFHLDPGNHQKLPDALVAEAAKAIKARKPTFLAICLDLLDNIGHDVGHDTPEYYGYLAKADGYIGTLLKAIEEAGIAQDTIVILTADHGGIGKKHGGKSLEELEIPFIIAGANVKASGEIKEEMMQYDCAAMIAYALGIAPHPVWRGRAIPRLFE